MEGKCTSIWYEESSRWDFVCLVRSPLKGGYVLIHQVWCSVNGKLVLFVWNEESSRQDIVRPDRSRMNGSLVLICPVRGIKQAGLRPSDTKSLERRVCPRPSGTMSRERKACRLPSGTRNQAGRTSYVRTEVTQMEGLSLSVQYEESSRRDFIHPIRSCSKGGFVLAHSV